MHAVGTANSVKFKEPFVLVIFVCVGPLDWLGYRTTFHLFSSGGLWSSLFSKSVLCSVLYFC